MLTHIKTSFVKSRVRLSIKIEKFVGRNLSDFWAQRLEEGRLTLTPGSSFNLGFIVFYLKAFSRTRASLFFRASNHEFYRENELD